MDLLIGLASVQWGTPRVNLILREANWQISLLVLFRVTLEVIYKIKIKIQIILEIMLINFSYSNLNTKFITLKSL